MKTILSRSLPAFLLLGTSLWLQATDEPKERSFQAPHDLKISVKMIGPVTQSADLQIICVFRHKLGGDTYIEALKDFDDKLRGLLSAVRNRGEFIGELGETFLFRPPANSIVPGQVLVIGLGDEKELSLSTLQSVGRVALREAVRLKATHVSFAPTIRDQGNQTLEVGDGDRAVIESVLSAYDTEKRLQQQGLTERFSIADWTIEAGPTFFESAATKVNEGIQSAGAALNSRDASPYVQTVP